MKIQKKKIFFGGWGSGRGGVGLGGVRVDVIEELKFLGNSQKKIGGVGGVWVRGVGLVGGSGWM